MKPAAIGEDRGAGEVGTAKQFDTAAAHLFIAGGGIRGREFAIGMALGDARSRIVTDVRKKPRS